MNARQALNSCLMAVLLLLSIPFSHAQSVTAASAAEQSAQTASKAASEAESSARAAASAASSAEAAAVWVVPSPWALYLVPAFVLLAAVIAIRQIVNSLSKTSWSLSDALSEEVPMPSFVVDTPATADGPATYRPRTDKEDKPALIPEMHASSSRLIALMGMMAILFLFLGFGVFAIFQFGVSGKVSDHMDRVGTFLISGVTLFAPYLANKFASVFKLK